MPILFKLNFVLAFCFSFCVCRGLQEASDANFGVRFSALNDRDPISLSQN